MLAPHGQFLPFVPPLSAAGATIGGTVAAGLNGSCRYRYGGIRDFLIGARIVDGRGGLIASGGKVVKNAAGFLLHQAMVGSAGRLGVLAELTFKVFPRAESRATVRVDAGDLAGALRVLSAMQAASFELEAADIEAPATVWLRLGGFAAAMPSRLDGVQRAAGAPSDRLEGEADAAVWRGAREFAWMPPGAALVRVPLTAGRLAGLDTVLEWAGARRRYAVGGNVAFISWTESIDRLSTTLETVGLAGQVLRGPAGRSLIGAVRPSEFERRVRMVMDPDGRFGGTPDAAPHSRRGAGPSGRHMARAVETCDCGSACRRARPTACWARKWTAARPHRPHDRRSRASCRSRTCCRSWIGASVHGVLSACRPASATASC